MECKEGLLKGCSVEPPRAKKVFLGLGGHSSSVQADLHSSIGFIHVVGGSN